MKILKFGGTSVGSAKAIQQVLQIIKKEKNAIIVCSAMSGVTNHLLKLIDTAAAGNDFKTDFKLLEEKHFDTIRELLPVTKHNEVLVSIKLAMNQLEELLTSVKNITEISERTKATILAFGECLSCTIVSAYLINENVNACFVDARSLIKTNSVYNNASVDTLLTEEAIINWHKTLNGKIPIVTGFIGSDKKNQTTNLGRGGSDYTAAIFGAALNVSEIQIWTDVNGFYTCDPREVKNAFVLTELSYEEAMELSYFGAKVIYPPTMIPAIAKQIPIVIKNTFNAEQKGTFIHNEVSNNSLPVKGISSISEISLINIEGNGMVGFKGFSGRLFNALANAGVNIILITQASSEHSISFAVTPEENEIALQAINAEFENEIHSKKIEPPTYENNLSIIAVVGKNMKNAKGISGKLFSALGKNGINVSAMAQGSSELNISVVIKKADLKKALNAVHDALFLSSVKSLHLYIVGTGNIGSELIQQIASSKAWLQKHQHLQLKVVGISNSRKMIFNSEEGLNIDDWKSTLNTDGVTANMDAFLKEIQLQNLPNSIFVDNTSSADIANLYEQLFKQNTSVVTCNKIANSSSFKNYESLQRISKLNRVDFNYETNVGAALPIINTLKNFLHSGDEVTSVEAVLSGTFSYVLNNYIGDKTFADVIKKAQELGYTEPDPRDDLNGEDFRRKVLIVAREMGIPLEKEQVQLESILPESCLKAASIPLFYEALEKAEEQFSTLKNKAKKENKKIRYIATITQKVAKIELKLVDDQHPFYSLSGSDNIISFTTNRYKTNPLVVKGPGAGASVTAAGVFADIIKVSSN